MLVGTDSLWSRSGLRGEGGELYSPFYAVKEHEKQHADLNLFERAHRHAEYRYEVTNIAIISF